MNVPAPSRYPWVLGPLLVLGAALGGLALRGSQDGLWEWDLGADRMRLSPRWKSMLGYAEGELGDSGAQWRACVEPQDLPALEQALQRHLARIFTARAAIELELGHVRERLQGLGAAAPS